MKYVLDTDTLSLIYAGHEKTSQRHAKVPSIDVAISVVTRVEVLRARFDHFLKATDEQELLRAHHLLMRSESSLRAIETLPFDEASANEYGKLRRMKKIKRIGNADLLIASIVLSRKAIVVTRNIKHFRQVPNLKIENWAD